MFGCISCLNPESMKVYVWKNLPKGYVLRLEQTDYNNSDDNIYLISLIHTVIRSMQLASKYPLKDLQVDAYTTSVGRQWSNHCPLIPTSVTQCR